MSDEKTTVLSPECAGRASLVLKMARVMAAMQNIATDGRNKSQGWNYASIHNVRNALRPLMADAGLAIIPTMTSVARDGNRTVVDVVYTIIDSETGATMQCAWTGESTQSGDKAINSALSNAQKGFLLQTFMGGWGDDDLEPDAHDIDYKPGDRRQQRTPKATPSKKRDDKPQQPTEMMTGETGESRVVDVRIIKRDGSPFVEAGDVYYKSTSFFRDAGIDPRGWPQDGSRINLPGHGVICEWQMTVSGEKRGTGVRVAPKPAEFEPKVVENAALDDVPLEKTATAGDPPF